MLICRMGRFSPSQGGRGGERKEEVFIVLFVFRNKKMFF